MMLHEIYPSRLDINYHPYEAEDRDVFLGFDHDGVYFTDTESLLLPAVGEMKEKLHAKSSDFVYLLSLDGKRYFSLMRDVREDFPDAVFLRPRDLRNMKPQAVSFAAAVASQIHGFYMRSRFCGKCGAPTFHDEKERLMRCPDCKNMIFPQICPSVIVAVLHEGRLLVTKYNPEHQMVNNGKTFAPTVNYALVAGYIESGESAEEAVRREVKEEVGLDVRNIRYYASQPWPMTSSLLFGYVCEADGDATVTIEENELSAAEWKRPEELPDRSQDTALTSHMIEAFRQGRLKI